MKVYMHKSLKGKSIAIFSNGKKMETTQISITRIFNNVPYSNITELYLVITR